MTVSAVLEAQVSTFGILASENSEAKVILGTLRDTYTSETPADLSCNIVAGWRC